MKPKIGVSMGYQPLGGRNCYTLIDLYADRVLSGGALPILIPPSDPPAFDDYLPGVDAMVFIGGRDYPPSFYGQKPVSATDMTRMRSESDLILARKVLWNTTLPALGICAGCQLFAIVDGGSLCQHLPDADRHEKGVMHSAEITQEGHLSRILGLKKDGSFQVNSFHHQCVEAEQCGRHFIITAKAFDGTVEALELPGSRMALGVQFHPERMDSLAPRFFDALAEEARKYALSAGRSL